MSICGHGDPANPTWTGRRSCRGQTYSSCLHGVERIHVYSVIWWMALKVGALRSKFNKESVNPNTFDPPVPFMVYDSYEMADPGLRFGEGGHGEVAQEPVVMAKLGPVPKGDNVKWEKWLERKHAIKRSYTEDDQELDQLNTGLSRYCEQCAATKPGSSSMHVSTWRFLSDEEAEDLIEEAKIHDVQCS